MHAEATSHNIVSPTMLGVVGTCCVVHANEHNNCQHCWRLSKETGQTFRPMQTDATLLAKNPQQHATMLLLVASVYMGL